MKTTKQVPEWVEKAQDKALSQGVNIGQWQAVKDLEGWIQANRPRRRAGRNTALDRRRARHAAIPGERATGDSLGAAHGDPCLDGFSAGPASISKCRAHKPTL